MTPRIVALPGGRRGLIIEDAPDLDAPNRTIRRARRVDPLRGLRLSDREWAAAERLRDDAALATGYREDARELVRVDRQGSTAGYSATQMDALRVMALLSSVAIPRPQWDVLQCVVLHWRSLADTAGELRVDRETAGRRLRGGLAGLAEFYG